MAATIRGRVLHRCKTTHHASETAPRVKYATHPELDAYARSVGGWRNAAARLGFNVGTVHGVRHGRRPPPPGFMAALASTGWRPDWFTDMAARIVTWATGSAPRVPWTMAERGRLARPRAIRSRGVHP